MNDSIYFAGALFRDTEDPSKLVFELVHCTGEDRPKKKKKRNGLLLTRHQAGLYALRDDGKSARLVDPRLQPSPVVPNVVELTEAQQTAIKLAIETDYYFD